MRSERKRQANQTSGNCTTCVVLTLYLLDKDKHLSQKNGVTDLDNVLEENKTAKAKVKI
jgi:hypothetical protein